MYISKKLFIASTAALVITLLFWGVYAFVFKKASPAAQPPIATEKPEEKPVAKDKENPKIIPLTDEAVISPTLDEENRVIKYYSKVTGKSYRIDYDGNNQRVLSNRELPGLIDVLWSPDTTKVLATFFSNGKNHYVYYNYAEDKGSSLNENIDAAVWQSDSKIFYHYNDPKSQKSTLNMADANGENWKEIGETDKKNVYLAAIPKTGIMSFWNKPDAFTETAFQTVPIIGGETKTLLNGKFGADYLWSPNGDKFLVSNLIERGGSKIQLAMANSNGGEYAPLFPTFVSKCVWSKDNKTVYYALPGSIPDGAVLPNDYFNNKFTTADTFSKINTATGETTRLIELDAINNKFDATNLFLNSDESFLFFVNRVDGKLYRMEL